MTTQQLNGDQDDLLWQHLKTIPAFRGLLRAVEARFYQQLDLEGPFLDVGCGDGNFAALTFDHPLDVGSDPWWGLLNAPRKEMYIITSSKIGAITCPFPTTTLPQPLATQS